MFTADQQVNIQVETVSCESVERRTDLFDSQPTRRCFLFEEEFTSWFGTKPAEPPRSSALFNQGFYCEGTGAAHAW